LHGIATRGPAADGLAPSIVRRHVSTTAREAIIVGNGPRADVPRRQELRRAKPRMARRTRRTDWSHRRGHGGRRGGTIEPQGKNRPCFVEQHPRAKAPSRKELRTAGDGGDEAPGPPGAHSNARKTFSNCSTSLLTCVHNAATSLASSATRVDWSSKP